MSICYYTFQGIYDFIFMKELPIKLSLETRAMKETLCQIYRSAKFGIGVNFVTLLIVTFILSAKLPAHIVISGFMLQTGILSWRIYSLFQYKKHSHALTDLDSINDWFRQFKSGAFMTGLAWGSLLFFLGDLPAEYHFFIYAVLLALAVSGVVTLGINSSIYNAYMLPILGACLIWLTLQDGLLYSAAGLLMGILILYYFFSVRYFSRSLNLAFMEKEVLKDYAVELQNDHAAFETLFDKSSDALLIIKEDIIVQCNEKIVALLGYQSKDEILNARLENFSPEHQPDGRRSDEKITEMIQHAVEKGVYEFEWLYSKANAETFWVEMVLTPITLHNDPVLHVTCRNISQKKKSTDELRILKERMELAFLGNHDGLWDWSLPDDSVYFSPRWKEMLGYCDNELSNDFATWNDRVHPDDLETTLLEIQKNIDGKTDYYEGIHRLKHKNGHWVWILDRGKTLYDEHGKAIRMIGTHTDISADKEMQLKFIQQNQIIEHIHDSVISTDLDGVISSWNHGSDILLGYKADEMIGQSIAIIYAPEEYKIFKKGIDRLLQEGEYHIDIALIKKHKAIVYVSLSLSLLRDEKGKPVGMISYAQDITERKAAEKKLLEQKNVLDHQAHHDVLTDLPNRVYFNERLEQGIEKARRSKTNLALFFIDLDHFKQINDSLGHDIGDKVLKAITRRLKSMIRKQDTLARLGGDEFTIIMEELAIAEYSSRLAQKILEALAQPVHIDDHILYVSSSIGISLYPQDGQSAHNLLKYADTAMYKAKDEGRNNFQFYSSEMTELVFERIAMETSLRQAIDNKEFIVYYQPQVDASSEQLIGMEALVRWQHDSMGLVSPDQFIPLAEETDLIVGLDQLVMKMAIEQFVLWHKQGLKPGVLALNLAMKQLEGKGFLPILKKNMQLFDCKPEWLELEITEGQIMKKPEEALIKLQQINDLGVGIAIDDFGSGYSSLSFLKRLPINKLKIDQLLVKDIPDNEDGIVIVKTIIALAKSLDMKLLGEGVETVAQKEFLQDNGCHAIQGYYYGRPMSADEMTAYLKGQ